MTARVLIIAGSDSGGGAGIQADIKTVTMLGGHAMTVVTAITAQNTLGVQAVHQIPTDMVLAQIESVVSDIGVDAIKIGMIGSADTANAVAAYLERLSPLPEREGPGVGRPLGERDTSRKPTDPQPLPSREGSRLPIIFDPVMIATSGSVLADSDTIAAFTRLMRVATLVTPNLPELAALGGEQAIRALGPAVLIKGGHAEGHHITDRLVTDAGETRWTNPRIETRHAHGTGCTLASGIATGLAQGLPLDAAIERAIAFVRAALANAPGLGAGHGPMGHALGASPFDQLKDRQCPA
ncbi:MULTISPECIES: bifunctional hydroxymethylpyrimidine kinase/phosphomethylpyrimidine kinase [unclassified Sphingomonas]|uniref:bifunctional hydroxymethylpyrimidine kinase/phosphomethylpyrimidine kinase n=1 Tax=unclassified Sphingomonas TaxID=196159 RepID=UPI000E70AE43|nr:MULTISPECIES: bifunctional hydroxymethylpyrimidine kinase/phosphomethylpyrimidine kinase [unclassified Sphingomonas]RKE47566.1 hydroxymethylpyrimidine/phosphomethylpyrimidine kinase [Sphingomonas sp. PP-CC-1A-547]TCM07239.1 hydroxymethylpyrimidine/phosphomethylpyrimidine kinase [Sphingomonas sp. PP-CC-3G-468]